MNPTTASHNRGITWLFQMFPDNWYTIAAYKRTFSILNTSTTKIWLYFSPNRAFPMLDYCYRVIFLSITFITWPNTSWTLINGSTHRVRGQGVLRYKTVKFCDRKTIMSSCGFENEWRWHILREQLCIDLQSAKNFTKTLPITAWWQHHSKNFLLNSSLEYYCYTNVPICVTKEDEMSFIPKFSEMVD
jgi:hypothetical protein